MKLVVDTNVLISGSLWEGPSSQLLEAVAAGKAEIVSSPDLLAEFAVVIARPKFLPRIIAKGATATELARKLSEKVTIVAPAHLPLPSALRDPKDLPVLACAVAARADAIVSGDDDLLALKTFENIPILTVREVLEKVGESK